jgi:hypothetical protein
MFPLINAVQSAINDKKENFLVHGKNWGQKIG